MDKELRGIAKALNEQGFVTRITSRGHLMVFLDGRPITTFAGTPSDRKSRANSLAHARRAGFRWPPER